MGKVNVGQAYDFYLSFSDDIAARIGSELKKMRRRRQLFYPTSNSPPHSSSSTSMAMDRQSPPPSINDISVDTYPSTSNGAASPKQKDVPLFTFRQVAMICERMCSEQEDKIRESYDKVLNDKLSGMVYDMLANT